MGFFSRWFWPRSARSEALSLYKIGLTWAEKNDAKSAVDAYTAAIDHPEAPDDVKAMALYNRALVFAAADHMQKAIADLNLVMEMPGHLPSIKLAARRRLERLHHRQDTAARANRPSTA
jgi:hypothetical protein